MTRWITHFCAPVFVFLAGVSAFLTVSAAAACAAQPLPFHARDLAGPDRAHARSLCMDLQLRSRLLLQPGDLRHRRVDDRAVSAGMSAARCDRSHSARNDRRAQSARSIKTEAFGRAAPIWNFLHEPGLLSLARREWFAVYPLIPWIGVMAAGYALGPVFTLDRERPLAVGWGLVAMIGFVLLRASNVYGDPAPWSVQPDAIAMLLSFINCENIRHRCCTGDDDRADIAALLRLRTRAVGSRRGSAPSAAFHSSIMWSMFLSSTRSR